MQRVVVLHITTVHVHVPLVASCGKMLQCEVEVIVHNILLQFAAKNIIYVARQVAKVDSETFNGFTAEWEQFIYCILYYYPVEVIFCTYSSSMF